MAKGKVFEVAFNLAAKMGNSFASTFSSASSQLKAMQSNVVALKAQTNTLEKSFIKGEITLVNYVQTLGKLQRQLKETKKLQEQLGRSMAAEKWAKDFQGRAVTGLATTAAAGAVTVSPVIAFANAEQSATALKAAMMDAEGKVGPAFERINRLAVDLGNKLPGATSDFHDLFKTMLQNGIEAEQILGGVGQAAAYLGVQLKLPYEEAGKFAAQMQKSTGTADADMMKLMDTVQRLTNLGVKADDLNQAFSKFGPTMAVLKEQGLEGANTYGILLAMLTQTGMEGSSAGNALGKVFRAGFDEKKLGKANDALVEFGMSLNFTNEQGEFAGLDNFFQQMEKLKKLNTTQRVSVIKELFGDDAEVLQVVNVLLEKGRAGYDDLVAKTAKQASLERRVNEQLKTMTNTWDSLTGTVTNFMAALGGPLAEKLKPIFDAANNFVGDSLMPWAEKNAGFIGTLGALAAGAVTLSAAWWGLGLAASTILAPLIASTRWLFMSRMATDGTVIASRAAVVATKAWTVAQWVWNAAMAAGRGLLSAGKLVAYYTVMGAIRVATVAWTAAQWLFNAAMMANPIGLVIMGIAGLIGIGYLLVQNWDTVKAWFVQLWNDPAAALQAFVDGIRAKLAPVLQWLEEKWDKIKSVFGISGGASTAVIKTGGVPIAANATGGIYGKGAFLTTFAEESAEAAIPLDGSSRSLSLWTQAGEMLGVRPGGGAVVQATFAPTINAGAGTDMAGIQQVLKDAMDDFERRLQALAAQERRLSYG